MLSTNRYFSCVLSDYLPLPLAIPIMCKYSDHLFRLVCVATYQQSGSERFHIDNSLIIVLNLGTNWLHPKDSVT